MRSRWLRDIVTLVAVLGVMVLVTLFDEFTKRQAPSGAPSPPPTTGRHLVKDGDSLALGRAIIRLHGLDAPEYYQSCDDATGTSFPCGKRAADVLRGLIGSSKLVCQEIERDRYRRIVARCKAGETDINAAMVRQGWAIAYRKHSRNYVGEESEAKAAKRGIWQGRFEVPENYRKRHQAGSLE
jgi:endonuclease YncB( thermonuclease family)